MNQFFWGLILCLRHTTGDENVGQVVNRSYAQAIFLGVIMFLRYTTEDENVGQVANLSYAQAIF